MVLIIDRHFPKSPRPGFDFGYEIVLGGSSAPIVAAAPRVRRTAP
jgi:hypothetical protein